MFEKVDRSSGWACRVLLRLSSNDIELLRNLDQANLIDEFKSAKRGSVIQKITAISGVVMLEVKHTIELRAASLNLATSWFKKLIKNWAFSKDLFGASKSNPKAVMFSSKIPKIRKFSIFQALTVNFINC